MVTREDINFLPFFCNLSEGVVGSMDFQSGVLDMS